MPTFAVVEAPSALGLFPRGAQDLPGTLLAAGLADRLGAARAGRVEPPPYNPRLDPEETGARGLTEALARALVWT